MNKKELDKVLLELKKRLDELNKAIVDSLSENTKKDKIEVAVLNGQQK